MKKIVVIVVLLSIPFMAIGAIVGFVAYAFYAGFEWMRNYIWELLG